MLRVWFQALLGHFRDRYIINYYYFLICQHLLVFRVRDNSLVRMEKKSVSLTVKLKSSIRETQNYWCVLIVAPIQHKKIIFRKNILFKSGVRCHASCVTCCVQHVTCHLSLTATATAMDHSPLTPPVYTAGCWCRSWPRPIHNELQGPKIHIILHRGFSPFLKTKFQILTPMSFHYFSWRSHLVNDKFRI